VLLKIQSYWDVMECCWTGKSQHLERQCVQNVTQYLCNNTAHHHLHQGLQELDCSTVKTKVLWPLKTSGTICPMTQWHIPECLYLQQSHCVSCRSCKFQVLQTRVMSRIVRTSWCFQGWWSSSPRRKVATFLPTKTASHPTEHSAVQQRKP